MARDHRTAYQRRNEAARAEGWASYGERRQAHRLGYPTPGEYRQARDAARVRRQATPENPRRAARTLRQGGEVGPLPGGRTGIVAEMTREAIDGMPDRRGVLRGGVWQELHRYRPTRRVYVWVGGVQIGSSRGYTLAHFLAMAARAGSLFELLIWLLAQNYRSEMPDSPEFASFTIS